MTSKKSAVDTFVNRAIVGVTMSAANTLTFEQIRFAVGTFQGVALVVEKVEIYPSNASLRELVAATDDIEYAIVTNDNLATLNVVDQDVIVKGKIVGAAAMVEPILIPIVHDFSNLSGGGLIVPANPLFFAATTSGAAAASIVRSIIYYRFVQLTDKDYVELIQMMIPGNI